jgi:group I intron endonuclease
MNANASGIYSITSPSGKKYIGSAKNIRSRWSTHLTAMRKGCHSSKALQAAYNKYGEALKFEVVEECPIESLLEREQFHIDEFDKKMLYNARLVAESNLGMKFSQEHCANIAKAKRGTKLSDEHKAKVGDFFRGKARSKADKAKISATNTGIKRARNKSGFCGVCPVVGNKWQGYARLNGVKRHLGVYPTVGLAAAIRMVYIELMNSGENSWLP